MDYTLSPFNHNQVWTQEYVSSFSSSLLNIDCNSGPSFVVRYDYMDLVDAILDGLYVVAPHYQVWIQGYRSVMKPYSMDNTLVPLITLATRIVLMLHSMD